MAYIEGITGLLTAVALAGFSFAAILFGLSARRLSPPIGRLIDKFAKTDSAGKLLRIIEKALDEDEEPIIDMKPAKTRKVRKVDTTPKLPAPSKQ